MDILYRTRRSESNECLRYSLRSLTNVVHEKVWLAGYKPRWVTNVEFVPVQQDWDNFKNSCSNLLCAVRKPDLNEDVLLVDDDTYILHPVTVPMISLGYLEDHIKDRTRHTQYVQRMINTLEYLESQGVEKPLSFEVHAPMPFKKSLMLEALENHQVINRQIYPRTVYGNLYHKDRVLFPKDNRDFKISMGTDHPMLDGWKKRIFISSDKFSFEGEVGDFVKSVLDFPSPYEVWTG